MLDIQLNLDTLCKFLDRGLCLKREGGGSVADPFGLWTSSPRNDTAQNETRSP